MGFNTCTISCNYHCYLVPNKTSRSPPKETLSLQLATSHFPCLLPVHGLTRIALGMSLPFKMHCPPKGTHEGICKERTHCRRWTIICRRYSASTQDVCQTILLSTCLMRHFRSSGFVKVFKVWLGFSSAKVAAVFLPFRYHNDLNIVARSEEGLSRWYTANHPLHGLSS